MAPNFFDAIKSYFSTELVQKAANYNGESESTVLDALKVAIPVSLAGIVQKAESSPQSLFNLAKEAFGSGIINNPGSTFSHSGGGIPAEGPSMIKAVFGDKFGSIANAISGFSGIKGATSSSLLGSIIPLALAWLGKHFTENNLNPNSALSFLSGQKNSILSNLPQGFNVSNLFDTKPVSDVRPASAPVVVAEKSGNKWLWPLLLALIGIALLWYLMKGCNKETPPAAVVTDTMATPQADTMSTSMATATVTLPNGKAIDARKGGIEDLLVAFLVSDTAKVSKDRWFDFNDLNFEFGTAEIVPESRKELDNIIEILKAFPKAKIKIGGYTDKVGSEPANKKLSLDRATAVTAELKKAGVGSQVLAPEGYGSDFAKFPADAPEQDRIKDRRVSVSVREK